MTSNQFIIHSPTKSILLPASHADLIAVLPRARLVELHGRGVVQVRHCEEATRILRAEGFDCPAPIEVHHQFPKVKGKFTPFPHQIRGAGFATLHQRCHLLLEMGTGKSYTAIAASDYLLEIGAIKKVLILCPMSCMTPVWLEEIWSGFYHNRNANIVHGTAAQRVERLEEPVEYHIGNHALIQVAVEAKSIKDRTVYQLRPEFHRLNDIDLIIFDESSMLRNSQTHLWHGLRALLKPTTRLWLLSGFPCPSGPENAWSQSMLVSPNKTPKYYGEWRRTTCTEIKKGQFSKWVPKPGSEQMVFNLLQPAFHASKEEVLSLPPLTIERREVELSKEQEKQYKKMKNQMVMEFQESGCKVDATNAADCFLKLRQILIGSVKSGEGEYADFGDIPRVKTVLEIIEQSPTKVIVISPFTGALRYVAEAIRKKKYSVEVIEGSVALKDRNDIIKRFQETDDPHVICCNPATMSHGVTLTAASTMIFLGPVAGNDVFQQTLGRINRQSQTNRMVVFELYANALESRMYDALDTAQDFQASVMELYRQEMTQI